MRTILSVLRETMVGVFALMRNIFAIIGLLSALYFLMSPTPKYDSSNTMAGTSEDATIIGSVLSPDGRLKATLFNENGGGAMSSYCFESVYVSSARISDQNSLREDNLVLLGSCGVLRSRGVDSIRWDSHDQLSIAIDLTKGASGINSMRIKGYAMNGEVRMVYAAHD